MVHGQPPSHAHSQRDTRTHHQMRRVSAPARRHGQQPSPQATEATSHHSPRRSLLKFSVVQ
jgi:hypothetical protein